MRNVGRRCSLEMCFDRVFSSRIRITKASNSFLEAMILALASLEITVYGSMHTVTKYRML